MPLMFTSRRLQGFGLATALLIFGLAAACSRRTGFEAGGRNTPSRQQEEVPFHQQAGTSSADAGIGDDHTSPRRPKSEGDLPFRLPASQTLTAGTLLTVRLDAPIATAKRGASKTFTAILDDPITVDGTTVLPHGATARGRLECSQGALKRGTGYVCLRLESIAIAGRTIPLQTSKLFAKGTVEASHEPSGGDTEPMHAPAAVRIAKGHRLTFRLTRDVVLGTGGEDMSNNFPSGSK
jgi:hypothetical protein